MLAKVGLSTEHGEWLQNQRGISLETATRAGLLSKGNHLAFQYHRNGQLLYTKARIALVDPDTGKTSKRFYAEPSGVPPILWNYDCLSETPSSVPLVITEGEIDALSFLEAGMNAVSVPNGAILREPGKGEIIIEEDSAFAYLWEKGALIEALDKFEQIILATDGDAPGDVLRGELAVRLGRDRCWFVTYPEGCKDANDVLVKFGDEGLADLVANAKPMVPSRLVSFGDIPDLDNGPSYKTGWPGMDPHMVMYPGTLTIVTGPPNHGKSTWAMGLVGNLAYDHGIKGTFLQFEDNPARNRDDLVRYYKSRKGGTDAMATIPQSEALAWVNRMFKTISPFEDQNDVSFNLDWLIAMIREAATRHGHKWLIIDPWNEVEHVFGKGMREDQYITHALLTLKKAARRYKIMLIIVAHPNNFGMKKENVEEMTLSDVNGGSPWRAKADLGVVVFMPDKDKSMRHIKIDKSKDWSKYGKPGTVSMSFRTAWGVWMFEGKGTL